MCVKIGPTHDLLSKSNAVVPLYLGGATSPRRKMGKSAVCDMAHAPVENESESQLYAQLPPHTLFAGNPGNLAHPTNVSGAEGQGRGSVFGTDRCTWPLKVECTLMRQEVDTQFVLLILRYPAHSQILFFFQVHASIYAYFCIGFVLILFFFHWIILGASKLWGRRRSVHFARSLRTVCTSSGLLWNLAAAAGFCSLRSRFSLTTSLALSFAASTLRKMISRNCDIQMD